MRLKNIALRCALLAAGLSALLSCVNRNNIAEGENLTEHANLLKLYDRGTYQEAVILNPDGKEVARYALVDRADSNKIDLPDGAVELKVPLSSVVMDSEVYASALEELKAEDALKGMFDTGYVTSPVLKTRIKDGVVSNLGPDDSPDIEKLLELGPEAIFVSYYDGMQTRAVDKTGIPIIKMYDLQETTPLGRAEWLRFIGLLFGKGKEADSIFKQVSADYDKEKGSLSKNDKLPKVMTETIYEGVWYVPGGNSYQANLIKDAGGRYFKADDNSSGSLNLSLEQVLDEAADADIWLIRTFDNNLDKDRLGKENPVYEQFQPFKTDRIYISHTTDSGLFREFPFHPERLLHDYILIFTNDTTSQLRYFRKME